ncbi:MAG: hypothetical protein LBK60_03415 [Verrucomicrobiales bacterium]|jgi:hypothetical protein|nr:hypothetical protein [Verrucomicrobiales bacterium]
MQTQYLKSIISVTLATLGCSSLHAQNWQHAKLGNVFKVGEELSLPLTVTDSAAVPWKVFDFWHKEIATGSDSATDGKVVIKPPVKDVGYYLAQATVGGQDVYTAFAIVRPHRSKDPLASPFGVMTHFAQGMNPNMLPLFKKIGIESIRDEHYWKNVEPTTKGEYVFDQRSEAYMKACADLHLAPLIAMTFGNKLYDGDGKGPSTPEAYAGYANYGVAMMNHYGPQIRWLEIWNEYNGTWYPTAAKHDRPKYYAELIKATYPVLKAAHPGVQILGGAAVLIPLPYFESLFKAGALDYMDGVVIHPYRVKPEGVDQEVAELQALIRKYNHGQDKPIWVTETGRHIKADHDWEQGRHMFEKGRAEGARYLARQYTLLLKQNVAKIYWYLASDHMDFVSMGLVRHHQKENSGMGVLDVAPSYVAYANLIHHLDGATYVRREAARDYTRAQVHLFQRGPEQIRVCWATRPAKLRIKTNQPLTVSNLMGAETQLTPANGALILDLGEDAIYLTGSVTGVEEIDTGARILASSLDDYSKTQGGNNWSYGVLKGGRHEELHQVETMWGYEWGTAPKSHCKITADGTHPDRRAGVDWAPDLRWHSPVTGKLRVTGYWSNNGQGDGITGVITVDGKEVSRVQAGVGGVKRVEVDVPIEVKQGSLVDFICYPNQNTSFDASNREFTIIQE